MNILQQIIEVKKEEVTLLKKQFSLSDFKGMELFARTTVSLHDSLKKSTPFGIIAEIKRSSPSAGTIRKDVFIEEIAEGYAMNGAAGISVLTDSKHFGGKINDLATVRKYVQTPLLRKDFIIDPIQIYEAKANGADAILLIAGVSEKNQLNDFHQIAHELGLDALVELYEEREIDKINFDTMKFIGVNNRDLRTMTINIKHSITMSKLLPKDITLVSESGIHSTDDVHRLLDSDIHCALIGEYFMKSENPGLALKLLLDSI